MSEEVFIISKIKHTVPWTSIIRDLNGKRIKGSSYEKELQKNKSKFRISESKSDKLYVKWKGYDSSFNSWNNRKGII